MTFLLELVKSAASDNTWNGMDTELDNLYR